MAHVNWVIFYELLNQLFLYHLELFSALHFLMGAISDAVFYCVPNPIPLMPLQITVGCLALVLLWAGVSHPQKWQNLMCFHRVANFFHRGC